jgi:threonine aldolase
MGLTAPFGILRYGSKEVIAEARRTRVLPSGGMRQAGFLAAAELYALDYMVERLADDQANAHRLAVRQLCGRASRPSISPQPA